MRTVAIGVTVVLGLSLLGACGKDSSSASGGGGKEIPIAVVIPLTGATAETAEQMKKSATLAAKEINADGGVAGRKIKLSFYDDELSPEGATREAQRAITRDGAVAIIGAQSSGEGLAIREVAERNKVPFITSSASAEAITLDAEYTFRIGPKLTDYANFVVDFAAKTGAKKPAVLHDSGASGLLLTDLFLGHAKEIGLATAGGAIEYPINATDVSSQIATASKRSPDAVIIGGAGGGDHGIVARTMAEQGLDVPLFGFSPILYADAISVAGDAYKTLPGVYSVQTLDETKPEFKDFAAKYAKEFGASKLPEQAAQTYDAVHVMADAMQASKGQGGSALAKAIEDLKPYVGAAGRTGALIEFSSGQHDGFDKDYLVGYKMNGDVAEQVID